MNPNVLQKLLARRERPTRSILSLYLSVDQSQPVNRNRGFETELRDIIASIRTTIDDSVELDKFNKAARRIEDFVSAYQPRASVLASFYDECDDFFWSVELGVFIPPQARWDRELFLQPLANAMDEFEQYAVVLVDRSNVRFFTVFLGRIEEHFREGFGREKVRHIKTAGTDHLGSASGLQRKADEQVRLNLRRVTREVDAIIEKEAISRLILAGTPEVTSELQGLLPKRLAARVIGAVDVAMESSVEEVLAATQKVAAEYRRGAELQGVKEVVTSAAKGQRAVVGLGHTLKAINSDRVWTLLYSKNFSTPGFECSKCSSLFSIENPTCSYCGARLEPVRDVIERVVEHLLRRGVRIEAVTGDAAVSLEDAGAIGAFLKTRTRSLQI